MGYGEGKEQRCCCHKGMFEGVTVLRCEGSLPANCLASARDKAVGRKEFFDTSSSTKASSSCCRTHSANSCDPGRHKRVSIPYLILPSANQCRVPHLKTNGAIAILVSLLEALARHNFGLLERILLGVEDLQRP